MSVVPIWSALVALFAAGLVGTALLAPLRLPWRPLEVLVRALLGLALVATFTVSAVLGAVVTVALVVHARRAPVAPSSDEALRWPRTALLAIAVVTLIATLRPPVPLFWDESVWLAKARVACEGPFELMARAVDPASDLVPRGYPIVAAVLEAALALGDPSLASLVAGGTGLVVATFALFALLLARVERREARATLVVLAATPLFWVHVRSVQLDLPVGLLAASLFLAIERVSARDPVGVPAAVVAALLLGIKDEGLALALAVGLAVLVHTRARGEASRAVVAACGALLGLVLTYRLELWLGGSTNDDHSPSTVALDVLPTLAREATREAIDVTTWGFVPALACAALVVGAQRRGAARATATALLLALGALAAALVLGPSQVRAFAMEGTLLDRLGLELLPLAAILIPRALLGTEPASTTTA